VADIMTEHIHRYRRRCQGHGDVC